MLLQYTLKKKKKMELTMTVLITSQFSYCPMVWMCNRRARNKKHFMKGLYKHSTFEKLLDKDKSFSIHPQNLQVLGTDMYKVNSNVPPDITK